MDSPNLIPLDYRNKEHVFAIAKLHAELLPHSPIPSLGFLFMTKFYYYKLVKDGLIKCDLYRYKGNYVGFLAYTKYPFTFMEKGKNSHFFYLAFILALSLIAKLSRIKILLKVIRLYNNRKSNIDENKVGELLSMGVLNPYTRIQDEKTGLRISHLLVENAMKYFINEGFEEIRAVIEKKNISVKLLYHLYGASFDEDPNDNNLQIVTLNSCRDRL